MQSFKYFFIQLIFVYSFTKAEPLFGNNIRIADENEFPFMVSINNKNHRNPDRQEYSHYCGGSLITRRHILTSAHCIEDMKSDDIEIVVGTVDLRENRTEFQVETAVTYLEWARSSCMKIDSIDHDIAVIKLSECVKDDVKLAVLTNGKNPNFYGLDATTAGWGETDFSSQSRHLRTTIMHILSHEECIKDINEALNEPSEKYYVEERILCTKTDPYALAGHSDSGNPLFINKNEIIGVTCSMCPSMEQYPTIPRTSRVNTFVGIDYYRRFINSATNDDPTCSEPKTPEITQAHRDAARKKLLALKNRKHIRIVPLDNSLGK